MTKKILFLKVPGSFTQVSGEVHFDKHNLSESFFDIQIPAKSITTGNDKRDNHLRGKDFFDTDNYRHIEFKSIKVEKSLKGYCSSGILTIKDSIRNVEVLFDDSENMLEGSLNIQRKDYGLGSKIPEFIIGNKVSIDFSVQL
ncbi:MAG: YceI family protein [Bacteroidota bacterium]